LESKGLWPLNPTTESNWSSRGQHVEFQRHEREEINSILQVSATLGCTNSAVVDSVKCKRIYLARKTIFCGRNFTKEQAIEEVAHLDKIQHSHIVRVVGTYTIAKELSILLYPVAEYNLDTFLREMADLFTNPTSQETDVPNYGMSVSKFFGCLCNAVTFLHSKMVKHMDLKPKNILVRKMKHHTAAHNSPWKIYIADFGIARSYASLAASETEGPTMFTRKYAAPEVVDWDKRGFSADIFSLGCVFVEIAATLAQMYAYSGRNSCPEDFVEKLDALVADGAASYQASIPAVQAFTRALQLGRVMHYYLRFRQKFAGDMIAQMLSLSPASRPTARILAAYFGNGDRCCSAAGTPDPLEAFPPSLGEAIDSHVGVDAVDSVQIRRPRTPVDLGGEKRSSFRMSNVDLSSTYNMT
jgi:serine/threonine protein kinase